jgi:hypothetical protein
VTTSSITGRALRGHEREYVRDVAQHLRDIPTAVRVALLREVEEHLADRPPTRDVDELERALGSPSEYARSLRDERGFGAERTDWLAHWNATRLRTRIVAVTSVVVVISLVVATAITVRWWLGWQADIAMNGFNASFSGAQPTKGVTDTRTMSSSQRTVQYDSTRELHVDFFFSSGRSVQIRKVALPQLLLGMLAVEATEVADARGDAHGNLIFKPFSSPVDVDVRPHTAGSWIRITFRFRNCEWWMAGSGEGFDRVHVTYDALGRTRHEDLALPMDLEIQSPSDAKCPARKSAVVGQDPEG